MAAKSIEVRIGNRKYPIEVENEQEETNIQLAAQMINDNIDKLKGNYVVTDYVDLLAMTALELASNSVEVKMPKVDTRSAADDETLQEIENLLDEALEA